MSFIETIILILLAYILVRFLRALFPQKRRKFRRRFQRRKVRRKRVKTYLSPKMRSKADWKYTKLLRKFKNRYRRNPTNHEKFRIIINASHITYRPRGTRSHWIRQRVRKYLLEKHNVVDRYKMR